MLTVKAATGWNVPYLKCNSLCHSFLTISPRVFCGVPTEQTLGEWPSSQSSVAYASVTALFHTLLTQTKRQPNAFCKSLSCLRRRAAGLTPSSGRWFPACCTAAQGGKVRAPRRCTSAAVLQFLKDVGITFLLLFPLVAKVFHSWLDGKWTFHLDTFWCLCWCVGIVVSSLCLLQVSVWRNGLFTASSLAFTPASTFTLVPGTSSKVSHSASLCIWPARNIKLLPTARDVILSTVLERRDKKRFSWHFQTEMPACVSVCVGTLKVVP